MATTTTTTPATPEVAPIPYSEYAWILLGMILVGLRATIIVSFILIPIIVAGDMEELACDAFYANHVVPYITASFFTLLPTIFAIRKLVNHQQSAIPILRLTALKWQRYWHGVLIVMQILTLWFYAVYCAGYLFHILNCFVFLAFLTSDLILQLFIYLAEKGFPRRK